MSIVRHPHGTPARYNHGPAGDGVDPCRQACCREAQMAAKRHRYRLAAYGRRTTTDAAPVREHVKALQADGLSVARLAVVSGISASTISPLIYGRPRLGKPPLRRVRVTTAAALLAVEVTLLTLDPRAATDATGTRRRIAALVATGRSVVEIATETGLAYNNLWCLLRGRRTRCEAWVALTICELYDRWWDVAPAPRTPREKQARSKALAMAARYDFAPPAAWDDDEIDDPAAGSQGVRRVAASERRARAS